MYTDTEQFDDQNNSLFTLTTVGFFILNTVLVVLMIIKIWP
jgi:hypothetical protein